jgi:hypothetical protein
MKEGYPKGQQRLANSAAKYRINFIWRAVIYMNNRGRNKMV